MIRRLGMHRWGVLVAQTRHQARTMPIQADTWCAAKPDAAFVSQAASSWLHQLTGLESVNMCNDYNRKSTMLVSDSGYCFVA